MGGHAKKPASTHQQPSADATRNPAPKPKPRQNAPGSGIGIDKMFDTLALDLGQTLAELDVEEEEEDHEFRASLVGYASEELVATSAKLVASLDAVPPGEWPRHRAAGDRAAQAVGRLLRFIRSRSAHKELEHQYLKEGVSAFDRVMAKMQSPGIESRPAAALSERATNTAKLEENAVSLAQSDVTSALKALRTRHVEAINTFQSLAPLPDHEEPPFVLELLKAFVIATLSVATDGMIDVVATAYAVAAEKALAHGAARVEKQMARAQAHAAGHAVSHGSEAAAQTAKRTAIREERAIEEELGVLAGPATVTGNGAGPAATHTAAAPTGHGASTHAEHESPIKKLFGLTAEGMYIKAVDGSDKKEGGKKPKGDERSAREVTVDQKAVALAFFASGLRTATEDKYAEYEKSVERMVIQSDVSDVELTQMAEALNTSSGKIYEQQITESTKSWATYLAQATLGKHKAGNETVANMDNYFGAPGANGRVFGTEKSGGDGVLHVELVIDRPGGRPHVDEEETRVTGVNSVLTPYILKDAEHLLARVRLPKEVHVQHRFARATIALDEHNRIKDVRNWEAIEPYVGESASAFWNHWGKDLEVT